MVYRYTHHIILKQLFITLLICLQSNEGIAQVSVLPGTPVFLSSKSDTLFSGENDLYLSESISGDGVIFLENTNCIITEDTPTVSNLIIKNSHPSIQGNIEIRSSVSLEYSDLSILDYLQFDVHVDVKIDGVNQHISVKNIFNYNLNIKGITGTKINSMYADNYILLFQDIECSKVFWGRLPFYASISISSESPPPRLTTFSA